VKADDAPAHAMSQIYSGDEKKIYSAVFYTADTPSREFCRIKFFRKKVQKNTLVLCLYLLRLRINTAENAHKDTYCYKCSVCSFLVLVSSRCRSYARIEHPKSFVFGVFSTSILLSQKSRFFTPPPLFFFSQTEVLSQKSFKTSPYTFSLSSGLSSYLTQRFL
jgi:hypothetical protein